MKKPFLTLSLTTALSTAFLTTFLPTTDLQASSEVIVEADPTAVGQHIGLHTKSVLVAQDTLRETHFQILDNLKEHWNLTGVTFKLAGIEYSHDGETLKTTSVGGYRLTAEDEIVARSLNTNIKGWIKKRQDFLNGYFKHRQVITAFSLLEAVNGRYAQSQVSLLRKLNLGDALEAWYLLEMSELVEHVKQDALDTVLPITEHFKTEDKADFLSLAAATLPQESYSVKVRAAVDGSLIHQVAFRAVFANVLRSNVDMEALRENFSSTTLGLVVSDNASYQDLLGAEAFLAMAMFQKFLVHPGEVLSLFATNEAALEEQQALYAKSNLVNERERPLLSTALAIDAVREKVRTDTKVNLTDGEADLYIATNDAPEKAAIIVAAKARIIDAKKLALETARDTARAAVDVVFTDTEADRYIAMGDAAEKEALVATVKARITAAEQLALETARNEARAAADVVFTDAEADTYSATDDDAAKEAVVVTAKARILAAAAVAAADGGKA